MRKPYFDVGRSGVEWSGVEIKVYKALGSWWKAIRALEAGGEL